MDWAAFDKPLHLKAAFLNDTLKPFYNYPIILKSNDVYTLALAGTSDQVDTLLIKESIPVQPATIAGFGS